MKENAFESSDSEDDKKSEPDVPATPKLTRLKAKQLNRQPAVPGSLKDPEPSEEVLALVHEDLTKSDDEDDDFQPGDNDSHSDDENTNNTFSDIDSQPSTPGSALLYNEQDVESPTKDGEFKVPRSRALSVVSCHALKRKLQRKLTIAL